mgnify:CR=1 FL=1
MRDGNQAIVDPMVSKLGEVMWVVDLNRQSLDRVVPAMAIARLLRRWRGEGSWGLAAALSASFLVVFLAVQWPFATFLNSPAAHNFVFAQHLYPYVVGPDWALARGEFLWAATGAALAQGLVVAFLLGTLSARFGLPAAL